MVYIKSSRAATALSGYIALHCIQSRGYELTIRNDKRKYAAGLIGDSKFRSVGRLVYGHNVSSSCWSNEITLIGKIAEMSMEELRYEHSP